MEVRVRYAPSPTGNQHIGGVRTALFNYLFARSQGGKFILRIEDTDRSRFFEGALQDIFDTFNWLGITYDEGPEKDGDYGPYFQSERVELHREHARKLVDSGHAYYCYCDSERLEQVRKEREANKQGSGYDRRCRDLSADESAKLAAELEAKGGKPVIRFKAPTEGKTSFKDNILGEIEVENKTLQDFILLKSDGFPTYHLANIVDDHLMKITHVLRAQEWIPSTPNHVLLYKAFGWDAPLFYHLPMVMGEDGQKLSKRHGATQLIEFKKRGYLAEAIINFISLLGWAYNDKDEVFTLAELEKIFDLKKINKSPAVFNYKKLNWFNGLYIRELSVEKLTELLLPQYVEAGLASAEPQGAELDYLRKVVSLIQERLEYVTGAAEMSGFMFGDECEYVTWEKIFPKKVEKETVIAILTDAKPILEAIGAKSADDVKHDIYQLTEKHGVKAGAVFMPLRIAVTGIDKSPDLFPVLEVLGKERVLTRIDKAIEKIKSEI